MNIRGESYPLRDLEKLLKGARGNRSSGKSGLDPLFFAVREEGLEGSAPPTQPGGS